MNCKKCNTVISKGYPHWCKNPEECPNKKICRINLVKCSCYKDGECIEFWLNCDYQKPVGER